MPSKVFLSLALVFSLCLSLPALAAEEPSPEMVEAVRRVLLAHPEIVLEALAKDRVALYHLVAQGNRILQRRQWEQAVRQKVKDPLRPALDPRRVWFGDPGAPNVIVEYSDFLCSACARGARYLEQLLAKYPHCFRVLLKHSPASELSEDIAIYYEAIGRQSPAKARRFAEELFRNQAEVKQKKLLAVERMVAGLGLDKKRFRRDLADKALRQRVQRDAAEAEGFGLEGTPIFIVNGVPLEGAATVSIFEDLFQVMGLELGDCQDSGH